jgi:hypothetical protein
MTNQLFSNTGLALLLAQFTACIALGLLFSLVLRRNAARAHQSLLIGLADAPQGMDLSGDHSRPMRLRRRGLGTETSRKGAHTWGSCRAP